MRRPARRRLSAARRRSGAAGAGRTRAHVRSSRADGAQVLRVGSVDAQQDAALRALFDRGEQYRELVAAAKTAAGDAAHPAKALRTLRRDFDAIAAIDFFPGEAQAPGAPGACRSRGSALPGEPARGDAAASAASQAADYQGRTWATRRHLWVDRMASAWLIRRFIDRKARFVWLDRPERLPQATRSASTSTAPHSPTSAARVTFEVLAASFGLDADPALAAHRRTSCTSSMSAASPVAEAPGVEAMLAGAAQPCRRRRRAAAPRPAAVFDYLYDELHRQENATND
ncbi:MAG: chromate resistance protein [Comamonadaceae bacterium]|nr:chromate resistance protein [Comamonadaceae bacterium]